MWDFLSKFLERTNLKDFSMWLVFLFIGFAFIPQSWVQWLNAKTPAFFPDWFTLANLGSVVFSLLALLVWQSLSASFTAYSQKLFTYRKYKTLLESLSDDEIAIVYEITSNHFSKTPLDSTSDVISLLSKGIIRRAGYSLGATYYILNEEFKNVFLKEFEKSREY